MMASCYQATCTPPWYHSRCDTLTGGECFLAAQADPALQSTLRRRCLLKCCLLAGGCLAGLILAELGLRLAGFRLGTDSAYQPDPYCGARLTPGFRGWHRREGRVWIEINSHGFRDRERSRTKPAGVFRIAVLGDSFAEALQVELNATFWSVLEQQLASRAPPGQQAEVLNFGVSGYGTAQELQLLRTYVWDYDPDLVLLLFLPANDVRNNCKSLEPDQGRPFFRLQDEQLVLDDSFLRAPERVRFQTSNWLQFKQAVIEHCRLAALIYQIRHRSSAPAQQLAIGEEPGLSLEAFCEPPRGEWELAWRITDRVLALMADEVRTRGARFVVAIANSGVEVAPEEIQAKIQTRWELADWLYPERRLAALGEQHDFQVIGLTQAMRDYARQQKTYLHGFANTLPGTGHWNETGHRVAGELLAKWLISSGILEQRESRL